MTALTQLVATHAPYARYPQNDVVRVPAHIMSTDVREASKRRVRMQETETEIRIEAIEKIAVDLKRIASVSEQALDLINWAWTVLLYGSVGLFVVAGVEHVQWGAIPSGTHCVVVQDDLYGVATLDTKAELDGALRTKDEIGIHDLIASGKALPLPRETKYLVLDSGGFLVFTYYRKIECSRENTTERRLGYEIQIWANSIPIPSPLLRKNRPPSATL